MLVFALFFSGPASEWGPIFKVVVASLIAHVIYWVILIREEEKR